MTAREVELTWSTTQKGDNTIVFVAEELDLKKSDNWTLLGKVIHMDTLVILFTTAVG